MVANEHSASRLSTNTLFFFLLLFLGLTAYLFSSFFMSGILALIFVVVSYPIYKNFVKMFFGKRVLAAVVFCLISFLLFAGILGAMGYFVLGEFFSLKDTAWDRLIVKVENTFNAEDWTKFIDDNTEKVKEIGQRIPFINEETITNFTESILEEASSAVRKVSGWVVGALSLGLDKLGAFLLGLLFFYLASLLFFIDGERMLSRLLYIMPLKNKHIKEVESRIKSLFKGWVIGNIAIMIAQGVLGGIGLALAGIPSAPVWGLIMIFTSLIPFIGTAMIWVPAAIILLIAGHYGAGIFLIIWGVVVVGTSDNFIRPMVMKGGAHLSGLILFFALIGGLQVMGLRGLILAPIIVVFFDAILHIYELEYEGELKKLSKE